ncbi:MAG TPA: hypothetical protein VFU37_12095, partial [Pyrinomonadaceae bacterium]|nr:hypothetical protein [Pyrinomonadaceae bacterium]
ARGNCDMDLRHNLEFGASWDLPKLNERGVAEKVLRDWGLDGRLMARSGFPVSLLGNQVIDPSTGSRFFAGLNLIAGQPIYLYGSQYPGGRAVNPAAFATTTGTNIGSAPRNFVRGFGAWQINLALRRRFSLGERIGLQFRAEVFNILNHPNFGRVDGTRTSATFGRAVNMLNQGLITMASQYQQGGPRSMQFALRLTF